MGNKDKKEGDPFFEVDNDNGTIRRKIDNSRVLAMNSLGWAKLEQELRSTFDTGSGVILQRMGYSYGRHLGKIAKLRGFSPEKVVDALLQFSRGEGWGKLSLNSGDLSVGGARLVIRGCYFCLHLKESTSAVCHMLVGLVGGISDEITGNTHRVLEERCSAKGDPICEIIIERLT